MKLHQTYTSYEEQHKLSLQLNPILVGELYLSKTLKHPVYIFKSGTFQPVINKGVVPSKDQILNLIQASHREVYLFKEDITDIKKSLETALTKVTRSLSIGDSLDNGTKHIKLLSLNLGNLYQNPHSDELLMLQYQSTLNLGKFLLDNRKFQPHFFQNLQKENFHFTLSHPMLSSILLISFLQSIHLFHEKEMENLFLTSYLKDIGLSMIPKEKYDLKTLSPRDQDLFASHADFSFDLLEGRIPLSKNYLTIIRYHHFLNDKIKEFISGDTAGNKKPEIIFGLESTLVSVFDILIAMTTERPYRRSLTLYQSLEIIKRMMADDYPQEFKALVNFLKQFYKN